MLNVCRGCGKKLTKERVLKIYKEKYRVWCWCGEENFYYDQIEVKEDKKQLKEEAKKE